MDHAEVRERLEAAMLGPGRLEAATEDAGPEGSQLRDHLATCPSCRAEADALRATAELLAAAAPDDLSAPPEARARVLRAVREMGVDRARTAPALAGPVAAGPAAALAPSPPRPAPRLRWPLLRVAFTGAMAVLVVAALSVGQGLVSQRDAASAEVAALTRVTAATDALLADRGHLLAGLKATDGSAAGTVLFGPASGRLVVFSVALDEHGSSEQYDCYLVRGSQRTWVGWMQEAGAVAYWVGTLPQGTSVQAGDVFEVVTGPGAKPLLSGTF